MASKPRGAQMSSHGNAAGQVLGCVQGLFGLEHVPAGTVKSNACKCVCESLH